MERIVHVAIILALGVERTLGWDGLKHIANHGHDHQHVHHHSGSTHASSSSGHHHLSPSTPSSYDLSSDSTTHDVCPEAKAQKSLSWDRKQFHMSCEPLVIWELAQLTKPNAKHFLEAGANLGYYGSRVFALWSPGTGLKPTSMQPHLEAEWRGSNSWSTCHDGAQSSDPTPLLCGDLDKGQGFELPPDEIANEPMCRAVRSEVEYHAFDGSAAFAKNISELVQKWWPGTQFEYNVAAVMQEAGGTMSFAQRLDEGGHILAHGPSTPKGGKQKNKGGRRELLAANEEEEYGQRHLRGDVREEMEGDARRLTSFESLEVPIITVDSYAKEKGLELDLLKVDVEGFDIAVLAGAVEQLERYIWFVQFEWGAQKWRPPPDQPPGPGGLNFTSFGGAVEALDYLGFTCYLMGDRYSTGRVLLQLTGCMKHLDFCLALGENCPHLPPEILKKGVPSPTKIHSRSDGWGKYGDAVCAHRTRNPAFAWALHYAEKHELKTVGESRKKLHTDPVVLRQLLDELKSRNKDSLHFA